MTGYEQLAQVPLGDNILAQIAATARTIMEARDAVVAAEEKLKEEQARLRSLEEEVLPELMATAGQEELTTIDGLKVSIKEMVRGQPSQEKADEAFAWLRDNGHGGIIKSKLVAELGRGQDDAAKRAMEALSELGLRSKREQGVHWQTLGSLVRELMAAGKPVPLDVLGVHVWKKADVKPKG